MTPTQRSVLIVWLVLNLVRPCLFSFSAIAAETNTDRFFLKGDGTLHIKNLHTEQEVLVSLISPDGTYDEKGFDKIDEVFGLSPQERAEHISPRLIFMLDYFSDLVAPGKVINMTSGYRSPEYNTSIRNAGGNVARTSLHMDGMALDFSMDGVDGKLLWKIVKEKDCCGVGHYGGATIHLDAGKPRFWETATSKTKTTESEDNQRIHLSTDFDRYRPGEPARLSFDSVSNFGFGVSPAVHIVDDAEGSHTVATAELKQESKTGCIAIPDRKASRFLQLDIPGNLAPGKYRLCVDFCKKPFERMPPKTVSNVIEIVRPKQ